MAWIEVHSPVPGDGRLAGAIERGLGGYPPEYSSPENAGERVPPAVLQDSIVLAHSLIPDALEHVFAAFGALLSPQLPLARRQHELIAATVSALNGCFY